MCWIFLYCFHTNTRLIRSCLLFIRLNLNHRLDFKCFKPQTGSFCRSYPRMASIPLLYSLSGFGLQVLTEKCKLLSMKTRFWPPDLLVKAPAPTRTASSGISARTRGRRKRDGPLLSLQCGIGWQRGGGGCALRCASRPSAQALVSRPPHFSYTRKQDSHRTITRHVVVVFGGHSETDEEPPGCKWPTRPVPAQRGGDIESAAKDARPFQISSKSPDVSPSDRILVTLITQGGFTAYRGFWNIGSVRNPSTFTWHSESNLSPGFDLCNQRSTNRGFDPTRSDLNVIILAWGVAAAPKRSHLLQSNEAQ